MLKANAQLAMGLGEVVVRIDLVRSPCPAEGGESLQRQLECRKGDALTVMAFRSLV